MKISLIYYKLLFVVDFIIKLYFMSKVNIIGLLLVAVFIIAPTLSQIVQTNIRVHDKYNGTRKAHNST